MVYVFGDYELDESRYTIRHAGKEVKTEPKALQLLSYLIRHRERFVSREELFKQLWPGQVVSEAALTRCIARLRTLLHDNGDEQHIIKTQYNRGYRFVVTVVEQSAEGSARNDAPAMAMRPVQPAVLPDGGSTSIAVLPLVNLSGDPTQEYFADGLTEDLISELCKVPELLVIARTSVFVYKRQAVNARQISQELGVRYLLEGSVRSSQKELRVTVQLVDATSGYTLWANSYERPLTQLFAVQDEVAKQIVTALAIRLPSARQPPTKNLEAYACFWRGMESYYQLSKEATGRARALFEQATTLDPTYADPYTALGMVSWREWAWLWTDDLTIADQGLALIGKALDLDPASPKAYAHQGLIYLMKAQHQEAAAAAERAIALSPSFAEAHRAFAEIALFDGHPMAALAAAEQAIRLDPHLVGYYSLFLGHAYRLLRQYDEAIAALRQALTWNPSFLAARAHLTAAYSERGWHEQARAELREGLRQNPGGTLERLRSRLPYKDPAETERFMGALQRAGLP
jgi:TolB-like protein/Flp pilus assembly protein TadD